MTLATLEVSTHIQETEQAAISRFFNTEDMARDWEIVPAEPVTEFGSLTEAYLASTRDLLERGRDKVESAEDEASEEGSAKDETPEVASAIVGAPLDTWHNIGQVALLTDAGFTEEQLGAHVTTVYFNPVRSAWYVEAVNKQERTAVIAKEYDETFDARWQTYDRQGRATYGDALTDSETYDFRDFLAGFIHSDAVQGHLAALRHRRDAVRERIDELVRKGGANSSLQGHFMPAKEILDAARHLQDGSQYAELKALEANRKHLGLLTTEAVVPHMDTASLPAADLQLNF